MTVASKHLGLDTKFFFKNYTVQRRHSQRTDTHLYERTHGNPTPMSIFKDWAGKSILEIDEVITGASLSTGTSPVKSWKIRSYEKSNPEPKVILRLL